MIKENIERLSGFDPEIGEAVMKEYDRQRGGIELIASENVVSEAVLLAAGTVLTNKYAEGYPARRYYGGCKCVDVIENIAIDSGKEDVAIISGIGTRNYYRKFGYEKVGPYMMKRLI